MRIGRSSSDGAAPARSTSGQPWESHVLKTGKLASFVIPDRIVCGRFDSINPHIRYRQSRATLKPPTYTQNGIFRLRLIARSNKNSEQLYITAHKAIRRFDAAKETLETVKFADKKLAAAIDPFGIECTSSGFLVISGTETNCIYSIDPGSNASPELEGVGTATVLH